jgi:putative phage-type endonuclease
MLINQDFTRDRRNYLGGSDIGAILGLSKYRSALDVWLEKTGQSELTRTSLPLRFGSFAESFIAQEYTSATGFELIHDERPITHPQYDFLVGHVDRFVFESPLEKEKVLLEESSQCAASHLLECKTANPFLQDDWGEPGSDQVPLPYLVQCIWYLMITGLKRCDLAVLFGNADFRIYQIHQDTELATMILDRAITFWEKHIKGNQAPPTQSEKDCLSLFNKGTALKSIEAVSSTYELSLHLQLLTERIETQEKEVSSIRQHLMNEMQDAELLTYQGKTLATWKTPKQSYRLDSKRLEQDHPELALQYQTPIQNSRRLVIKKLHRPSESLNIEHQMEQS